MVIDCRCISTEGFLFSSSLIVTIWTGSSDDLCDSVCGIFDLGGCLQPCKNKLVVLFRLGHL